MVPERASNCSEEQAGTVRRARRSVISEQSPPLPINRRQRLSRNRSGETAAAVSTGYARGTLFDEAKTLPRDRKDWYD